MGYYFAGHKREISMKLSRRRFVGLAVAASALPDMSLATGFPSALIGRWHAESIRRRGVAKEAHAVIQIAADGRVTGSGGCNRLFGTYTPEKDDVPIRYGLVKALTTYSAVKICFFEWANIFRDMVHARHPRDMLGYMFGPPGWAPGGKGLTTEDLRREMKRLTGAPTGVPPEALLDGKLAQGADAVLSEDESPAPAR